SGRWRLRLQQRTEGQMFKRNAIQLISWAMAKSRISKLLDRTNGRRGGVILVYHEIGRGPLFRQLTQLSGVYTFVPLDEFVMRLGQGKCTSGLTAITFDDGVGETTETAASIAIANGWPMTFYLPTRYLDTREPSWFLELDPLLRRAKGATLSLNGR